MNCTRFLTPLFTLFFTLLFTPFFTQAPGAQSPGITVRGITFDSLTQRPLPGAFVFIEGQSRSTRSDENGQFAFDRMQPGRYVLSMQHAALDSLGLSGVTGRATVTDGREPVVLSIPSFATMWRTMCGAREVPLDSGFVYGTIRDARTGKPVPAASVDVSWVSLSKIDRDGSTQVNQRRWRSLARSDDSGDFAVCGLPPDDMVRIRGVSDSSATDLIDLPISASRVRRRDLLLASAVDTASRGAVAGFLSDPNGRPLYNVRVSIEGVPEARSASDGRFLIPRVPSGTRQVEFTAIGMMPTSSIVDVREGDTVRVAAMLRNVTTLDVVKVTGTTSQIRRIMGIEERRRTGFGKFLDSTSFNQSQTVSSIFAGVSGVNVARVGPGSKYGLFLPRGAGKCAASIVLDGVPRVGQDDLDMLRASDIAAIEIFPRVYSVPTELMPARAVNCGVIAIWTKNAFR